MVKINMQATGQQIQTITSNAGYSAKDLSIQLNVDGTTPYYWFNGSSLPKWETLFNLAHLCKCEISDFFIIEEDEADE